MFAVRNDGSRQINEESVGFGKKMGKWLVSLMICISVGIFSWIAYSSYKYSSPPKNIDEIPLVRKDMTPIRIQPPETSESSISNNDRMIYSNLWTSPQYSANELGEKTPEQAVVQEKAEKEDIGSHKKLSEKSVKDKQALEKKIVEKKNVEKKDRKTVKSKSLTSAFDVIQ